MRIKRNNYIFQVAFNLILNLYMEWVIILMLELNLNWSISISYWIIKCLYLTLHYTYSQLWFTQNLPCTSTTEFFSLSTVNDAEVSSKFQHRLISELSLIKVKCPPSPITSISSRYWLSLPHKLALVSKFVWLSYTQCIQKIKITYFTLYCLFEGGEV